MKKLITLCFALLACVLSVSAGNKAAMLKLDGSDASAAERAALEWFSTTNKGDVVTSLDNLNNYSVLWIMIDRVGRNQNSILLHSMATSKS